MELKRFGDSVELAKENTNNDDMPKMDTSVSQKTIDALKLIDENIRNAEQKSGSVLVGNQFFR